MKIMTKEQALQKIKELQEFIVNLDEKEKFKHGDIVTCSLGKRIIINVESLKICNLSYYAHVVFDENGGVTSWFGDKSDKSQVDFYTKVRNVFDV